MTKARDISSLANGVPNSLINLDSAEIPNLDTSKITTGELPNARVADLPASKITTGTIASARIDNASLNAITALPAGVGGSPMFKNRIINGDMNISQRGTSFSLASGGGSFFFGVDRFSTDNYQWSAGSNITVSQDTSVYPTGFLSSYKHLTGATGLTFGAGGSQYIKQSIEGYNIASCYTGNITISFWVRASTAGQYNILLTNSWSTFERYSTRNYTINSANTWEKKTITVDLSAGITSGGTWNTTNGHGLSLAFMLGAHANRTGNDGLNTWATGGSPNYSFQTTGSVNLATIANSTFNITGVQLEAGTSATDFEFLPYDINLNRCFRYFYSTMYINGANSFTAPTTNGLEYDGSRQVFADVIGYRSQFIEHPITMRATPSITVFNGNNGGTSSQIFLRLHSGATQNFNCFTQAFYPMGFNFAGYTGVSVGNSGDQVGIFNVHFKCEAEL